MHLPPTLLVGVFLFKKKIKVWVGSCARVETERCGKGGVAGRLCVGCGRWWSGRLWSDLGVMVVRVISEGARLEVVASTGVSIV